VVKRYVQVLRSCALVTKLFFFGLLVLSSHVEIRNYRSPLHSFTLVHGDNCKTSGLENNVAESFHRKSCFREVKGQGLKARSENASQLLQKNAELQVHRSQQKQVTGERTCIILVYASFHPAICSSMLCTACFNETIFKSCPCHPTPCMICEHAFSGWDHRLVTTMPESNHIRSPPTVIPH